MSRPRITAGTLLDLAVQLDRDDAAEASTLRERDHRIGRDVDHGQDDAARVTAWLHRLDDPPHRGGVTLTVIGLVAVFLGLVFGFATARAVFHYDGSSPVNVVHILAVFIVLQGFTLVLFALAAMPGRGGLQEALRELSPGRLAPLVTRWLPGETRAALGRIVGRAGRHQRVYGRVQKWQVLGWSQALALAFNLAALAAALQLIVFSDLAFAWSTTLDVEPAAMHRFTSVLSLPWAWWPDAVPSLELVRRTQTYQVEAFAGSLDDEQARWFARWWPFVVMAMLTYGLIPRLITYGLTRWRLRGAVRSAVALTPGVDRVLQRMTATRVETRAATMPAGSDVSASHDEAPQLEPAAETAACVVAWSGVDAPNDALHAGGGNSLDEDRRTITRAAETGGPVRVRVKAWEPPVLEFADFITDLRGAVGDGRMIEVQPVAADGEARYAGQWKAELSEMNDPWLRVVRDTSGAGVVDV